MKKNLFTKSMSVFLTALMLLSCWVFVPEVHEHSEAEAAALESASSLYNKALLNSINTSIDTTMTTVIGKFKDPDMEGDENASFHVSQFGSQHYKNIFYSPTVDINGYAVFWGSDVISGIDSVRVYYPETVMIYDGSSTKPQMGVVACLDGASRGTVRAVSLYLNANANGLVITDHWKGYTTANLAHIINMHNGSYQFANTYEEHSSYKINTKNNGEWYFYASDLRFDGTLASDEFVRTITPTWGFYGGKRNTANRYTQTASKNIYVMNVKGYRDLVSTIASDKANYINNAAKYTPESIKAYVSAANAIINLNPKNVSQSGSAVATWGTNMSTALTNYNNAKNGLVNREFEVTYDNIFSLADWKYSASSENSNFTVDLTNGKVSVKNPNASGEYVTYHSGSSGNANTRNTNYYAMPVVGGQEYTFKYTTDHADTQMFAFFYDKNGGCAHESTFGNYNFSVKNGTGEATFRAPDNATQMEIRFDNNTGATTANFWDIMIYPAKLETELGISSWSNRPIRTLYAYNASVGTLPTPVRPGYIFDGWMEDTDGDGVGDTAPSGNVTSTRVLYSTWTPGTMDVGYDNLFSLAAWANTKSNGKGNTTNTTNIAVDLDAGTIAVTGKSDAYTTYGGGADQYHVAVTPGETYIFDYDATSTNGTYQAFVFFYNDAGSGVTGAIYNGSAQSNAHIGLYNGQPITFTVPSGCTKIGFRVGICGDTEGTATYSNIGVYKLADYNAYAKDYEKVREAFLIGETKNLMAPTREGYDFDGWYLADGTTKVTTTASFDANTIVYAHWTKLYTVTYYYGDQTTVLATETVREGETVPALPTVHPTKDTDDQYAYEFDYWYANGQEFTASTTITSDISVFPVFEKVAHGNFQFYLETDATCDSNATVQKYCGKCWYDFGVVTYNPDEDPNAADNTGWLKKGHDYSRGQILENSSTGNTDTDTHSIKCARYNTCKSVQKVTHTWTAGDPQGATCVIPGTIKHTCPCGAEKTTTGTTAPNVHVNTTTQNAVEPTCTTDGKYADTYCNDCKKVIEEGAVRPMLGHSFTNYVSNGDATCTEDGTETAKCDRCTVTDTRIEVNSKLGHDWIETKSDENFASAATCNNGTMYYYDCSRCDASSKDNGGATWEDEASRLDHDYTGTVRDNNNGTHSYLCANGCGTYGYNKVKEASKACTYGEWDTTGETQHVKTCTECGYKLKENHTFTDWATTDNFKEADGQHSKTCTVCDKVVTEDCTYTLTSYAETCTTDGFTIHKCNLCGHQYTTQDKGKTGHDYTGDVKTYNNGYHNYLCKNGCKTYGYNGVQNATKECTYKYDNTAVGTHKVSCTECTYSFTEGCSGGQATCTEQATCEKCYTKYGETSPHSYTGTPVVLEGDKHAYLCVFCSTEGLYGVGDEKDATESCSGGTATCKNLAVCSICNDTYGDYAAHVFNGDPVVLDGDVHAYECSVCDKENLYGVGNTDYATEACSGGTATCTDLAVCDICKDTHGALDVDNHNWGAWTNIEGTETHKRICGYNNDHEEVATCESSGKAIVEADCESEGYDLNTCDFCNHQWKTNFVAPLDHDWSEWVNNEDGTHTRTCQRLGCHYADDHTAKTETASCTKENAKADVKLPTCLDGGYTTYTCNDCGYVWVDDYTDATGHSYNEKTKKTDAKYKRTTKDCVTDETYWYVCDNCDVSAETEADLDEYKDTVLYWVRYEATGHSFDKKDTAAEYLATAATCTSKAKYYYSCSVCGASSKDTEYEKTFEYGTMLGHDWVETETYLKSEADCINNEVYYLECSKCHISSKDETGATWEKEDTLKGHKFDYEGGHTEAVAATCLTAGNVEYYTCETCGKHFNADKTKELAADKLVIKALGHDYEDVPAKAATCEEAGYTKHKQCQREDCLYRNKDYQVIAAKGHEFKAENGYYTENNYHAYYCTRYDDCGAYGVDNVKWSVVDGVVTGGVECVFTGKYENYEADGVHYHKQYCECGNSKSVACVDAEPTEVLPTCTEDGYFIHTCDVCNFVWNVASGKAALTHDLKIASNGNGTHSAKCQREGCGYAEDAVACSTATPATKCGTYDVCDICKTAFGEAKPHVFTEYKYNNDAKCGVNGTKTAVCDTCEVEDKATHTIVAEGTALAHVMVVFDDADSLQYKVSGTWYYNNEFGYDLSKWAGMPENFDKTMIYRPTCSEDGVAISYCTREGCSHYVTKAASKLDDGHVWGDEVNAGGNCATGVTFRKECTLCGATTTRVETVEHTYVERVHAPATCDEAEYIYKVCSVCGDDVEEHIGEALGHDWATDVIEKEATCAQAGRKYSICSRCNTASAKIEIPRLGHIWDAEGFTPDMLEYDDNAIYVEAADATCQYEGHTGYYKCLNCSYDQHLDEEWRKDNIIAKKDHVDNDDDGKCDGCNAKLYGEDNSKNCDCICHKENWFSKIIYKILRFFWKLFGIGKSCDCGNVHY